MAWRGGSELPVVNLQKLFETLLITKILPQKLGLSNTFSENPRNAERQVNGIAVTATDFLTTNCLDIPTEV